MQYNTKCVYVFCFVEFLPNSIIQKVQSRCPDSTLKHLYLVQKESEVVLFLIPQIQLEKVNEKLCSFPTCAFLNLPHAAVTMILVEIDDFGGILP